MKPWGTKKIIAMVALTVATALACWLAVERITGRQSADDRGPALQPVPVAVADIQRGPMVHRRVFNGELQALAEFVVAPKVGGRVMRMAVKIADAVQRGQVVAELDNDEFVQAVVQAQADLEVARANLAQARIAVEIAGREFQRTESLLKRGIASDSEYDAARQDQMASMAHLKVCEAQVAKAEASLETARIRLGYTQVTAGWSGGGEQRVVAARFVDEGQTVAPNDPLLSIVELHPIVGIFFVPERDYAHLRTGQTATLTTDAFPGEPFSGQIDRIAPVFQPSTRQARVEMRIDNPRQRLKPGMFIRAEVVLEQVPDAVLVPEQALTQRDDRQGLFLVNPDGRSVAWREVTVGIRDGQWLQVVGAELAGQVVVLGQHLVRDGSPITIPAAAGPGEGTAKDRDP